MIALTSPILLSSSDEGDGSFDLGMKICPFEFDVTGTDSQHCVIKTPIMCLHCGAYFNIYASVDESNDAWVCNLCQSSNHSVFSSSSKSGDLYKLYGELRSKYIDYIEPCRDPRTQNRIDAVRKVIFVVDTKSMEDRGVFEIIEKALQTIPTGTKVAILALSECINVLKLGDLVHYTSVIGCDCFYGYSDKDHGCMNTIFEKEYHFSSAHNVLKHLTTIQNALSALIPPKNSQARHYTSKIKAHVNVVMSLIRRLSLHAPSNYVGSQCLMFLSQPMDTAAMTSHYTTHKSTVTNNETSHTRYLQSYADEGKKCYSNRIWIDIYYAQYTSYTHLDYLDALATSSGGAFYYSQTFLDENIRDNCISQLRNAFNGHFNIGNFLSHESFQYPSRDESVTAIEVRSTPHMSVDSITGRIVSYEDLPIPCNFASNMNQYQSGKPSNLANPTQTRENYCGADKFHIEYAMKNADASSFGGHGGLVTKEEVEKRFESLAKNAAQNDSLAMGFMHNRKLSNMVTVRFANHAHEYLKSKDLGTGLEYAYVQVVVRFSAYLFDQNGQLQGDGSNRGIVNQSGNSSNGYSLYKITRVFTVRLNVTDDASEYFHGFHARLWSTVMTRSIVADFHCKVSDFYDGAKKYIPIQSNSRNRSNKTAILENFRGEFCTDIESFLNLIASSWTRSMPSIKSIEEKLHEVAKSLYFLREGPLLNGPSMNFYESYIFRAMYLTTDYHSDVCILCPTIYNINAMVLQSLSSVDEIHDKLTIFEPFTTSLVPKSIAIIDCGNIIVIRPGMQVSIEKSTSNIPLESASATLKSSSGDHNDAQSSMPLAPPTSQTPISLSKPSMDEENIYISREKYLLLSKYCRDKLLFGTKRCEIPTILVLSSHRDPQQRFAITRLSPLQNEPRDIQVLYNPELISLPPTDLEDLDQSFPFTDQISFHRFIAETAPMLLRAKLETLRFVQSAGVEAMKMQSRDYGAGTPQSISHSPYNPNNSRATTMNRDVEGNQEGSQDIRRNVGQEASTVGGIFSQIAGLFSRPKVEESKSASHSNVESVDRDAADV